MTFLPLAGADLGHEDGGVTHPFAVEHEVRQRQQDLVALAEAGRAASRARARSRGRTVTGPVDRWRQTVGRALVTLGVIVGLPRERRRPAVDHAVALLERDPCVT